MERFKQRIKYYLIGFIAGLFIMFMIFGNRGCSWLPGNRVKNMIAEKEIFISDSLYEVMNCAGVTHEDIYGLLNDNGDVNFSQSITNVYPKKYLLEGEKNDKPIGITYALYDSTAEVINFTFEGQQNCTSVLSSKTKRTVPLPDSEVRAIIESHEFRIMTKAECLLACLGISEQEIFAFHQTAVFDVANSQPRLFPNPVYVMKGKIRNTEYSVTYIIGENRSRIADITPNNCNCTE